MSSSTGAIAALTSVVATLLALAVEVGLLVIALTIVKPRREDAVLPLAGGAGLHLFATIVWPIVTSLLVPMIGRTESTMGMYQVVSMVLTLVRTAGWVAILVGIVKLANASPPPGPRAPWP